MAAGELGYYLESLEEMTDEFVCPGRFEKKVCQNIFSECGEKNGLSDLILRAEQGDEAADAIVKKIIRKIAVVIALSLIHIQMCIRDRTDTGPIILQKAVEGEQDDTPEMLQRRVMEQAEWKILPEAIHLIANGKVHVENGHAFIKNLQNVEALKNDRRDEKTGRSFRNVKRFVQTGGIYHENICLLYTSRCV